MLRVGQTMIKCSVNICVMAGSQRQDFITALLRLSVTLHDSGYYKVLPFFPNTHQTVGKHPSCARVLPLLPASGQ